MLCEKCLQAEATIHVSVREPGKPELDSDYCHACYQIQAANPTPADPPACPLSRFTIKGLMIVAGLVAILNAAVVLLIRHDPFAVTAARISDFTIRALLIDNLCFAVFLSECLAVFWLEKLARYRKRGGKAPTMLGKSDGSPIEPVEVWSQAALRERTFRTLLHVYSMSYYFGFFPPSLDPDSWTSRLDLGLLLAFVMLMFSVWVLLLWGFAASGRRRVP